MSMFQDGYDAGWGEYQKLVLHELQTHSSDLREIRKDMSSLKTEIGMLKVKSGLWGLIGGVISMIPVAVVVILELIK